MNIFLWNNNKWELFKDVKKEELEKRKIIISNHATVGYYAKVGYNATVGNNAKVGDNATVDKFPDISKQAILINVGIDISKGYATFYKTVRPDMTDFYTGKHHYIKGKGAEIKGLTMDQNVECGEGFHFTNIWQAIAFASGKEYVLISATVKLCDILSVYNKIRCRKYSNMKVVKFDGIK